MAASGGALNSPHFAVSKKTRTSKNLIFTSVNTIPDSSPHRFVFRQTTVEQLTESTISKYAASAFFFDARDVAQVFPESIEADQGIFSSRSESLPFPEVSVIQEKEQLILFCACSQEPGKLCEHQALVLTAILRRDELNVFFNARLRLEKLRKFAVDYGMENEQDLDRYFQLSFQQGKAVVVPRMQALLPVTKESLRAMNEQLLPDSGAAVSPATEDQPVFVVLREHRHYKHLQIELYRSERTKEGKIKNPLHAVSPLEKIWETEDAQELKFFTGIHKFQGHAASKRTKGDLTALRAIIRNPLGYAFYSHDNGKSEKVSAASLTEVKAELMSGKFSLEVDRNGSFFELQGNLSTHGTMYGLEALSVQFSYFIQAENTLYLPQQLEVLGLLDLLKRKQDKLLIHASRFRDFKSGILHQLEEQVDISYKYIEPATSTQLKANGFDQLEEKIIYLSDFGSHVMIIPVMRYGEVEVQLRSKKLIYSIDAKGNEFFVKRNEPGELQFAMEVIRQHPYLEEQQANDLQYYYLHKRHFLDEDWFLNTFEAWRNNGISVLGFNELEGNKLNPNKVKIDIKVLSGINWFNTEIDVKFGNKKASLKHLHKAIRNKSKYVKLDDGTFGILPEAWMEKFSRYFNSGEIIDLKTLQIPKISFSAVEALFEEEMLDPYVKGELEAYREKFAGFDSIKPVEVPEALHAELRPYQKEGLSWLNFLDDFNFGGCLADDMGLGKSIQVIAFILSQREKSSHNVNLLVVPATLIFNWIREIEKFAPSIKVLVLHGSNRNKGTAGFRDYEVILTSYGTLLSDIHFLKAYTFNYIFLDESQNIRNPETERYKAVRLLQSRNKIAITGTPLENNTFDLYSQFSFACPGLLGSKQYFRDVYSSPVDQFKSSKRAAELQNKIRPFMLRRTKLQVAPELPEKTEMILYCEMAEDQRNMYKAYEKEFRDYISATTHDELNKNSMNVLRGLTKLRQICDAPVLADELSEGISSAKISLLAEQIESKAPEHKILVFSQFVSMLELIRKELDARRIKNVSLTGKTRNREAVVNRFQQDPEVKVFLISLKAGGTGLNLTEADYVYLVDPWWNPAVENQAIDRTHRIGQHKNVMAVRLICPDTVEEKIMKLQETKKELAGELINEDSSFLKSLTKDTLLDLLSDLR